VYISHFSRTLLGEIPFSIGDIIYGTTIIYCIYWFYKNRKLHWKRKLWSVLNFLSVFYFLFHLLWAFNYYRVPLFEKMNIKTEYSEADLVTFTEKLITKTNDVQLAITKNQNEKVTNPYSQDSIFSMTQNGYDNLSKIYPFFQYEIPSRKKSLFSLPLTYMGFGGYLNPFTNESQVNFKLPMFGFPNVVCHEMAHQIGFASESECNFIGFLAGIKNEDLYFQYSALSNALRYCMSNIAMKNEKQFEVLKKKINSGIIANYKESDLFWKQYDTIIDKGFHAFYDQFLKTNQQEDGIDSYSKFVDLLINYYKGKKL
jgi:amino acid transporter